MGYKKTTHNRNRRTFGVGFSTSSCVEYCNTHCKCNPRSENQKSPQTRSTKSTRSCYDYNAGNIPVPSTKNTQTSSTAPLLVSSGSNSGTSTPEPVNPPPLSQVNTGPCGPQVDQQMVKLLPLQTSRVVDWAERGEGYGDVGEVNGDLPEAGGFDSSKSRIDPPDARLARSELHIPELCSLGEIQ